MSATLDYYKHNSRSDMIRNDGTQYYEYRMCRCNLCDEYRSCRKEPLGISNLGKNDIVFWYGGNVVPDGKSMEDTWDDMLKTFSVATFGDKIYAELERDAKRWRAVVDDKVPSVFLGTVMSDGKPVVERVDAWIAEQEARDDS